MAPRVLVEGIDDDFDVRAMVPGVSNISTSMIAPLDTFLRAFAAGEIRSYPDLVFNGYVTP